MPVETRRMENDLATIVDANTALFNDSALAKLEHCLSGTTFTTAGVSSHMSTKDMEWLLIHCGASIVKRATGGTDFLIKGSRVGDMMHHTPSDKVEDLQVYKEAMENGVGILTTLEFFKLLCTAVPEISSKQLEEGWHENIKFSLRDTSAYGIPDRHEHKYSLEFAKSNRSRCHGHCKRIIPVGDIRLKACFDPLTDSFVYFRCLKCITPTILEHIKKEWKGEDGHPGNLLDFALHQSDEILRMFQVAGGMEPIAPHPVELGTAINDPNRHQWAQNLADYLEKVAHDEVARRKEEHAVEAAENAALMQVVPAAKKDATLGKRKRHDVYASDELQDFMHNIPPNVLNTSKENFTHSVRENTPTVAT